MELLLRTVLKVPAMAIDLMLSSLESRVLEIPAVGSDFFLQ